jgi:uncharacterized membrane protein YdjX (TVP38/TMEM64 family)
MFPVSTALVVIAFLTLPFTFSWPQNLADLAQLGRELHGYSQSGPGALAHVFGVVSAATIWMHAWSIPGSVLWVSRTTLLYFPVLIMADPKIKKNVLAGALFSPLLATVLLAVLTTVGSILATLLSAPLSPFITRFLPRPLALARNIFDADSEGSTKAPSPTWVRLTVFRLVGIVPWSGINVACGVLGVSLRDCFLGTFIGAIPWTAVTCQVGAHSPRVIRIQLTLVSIDRRHTSDVGVYAFPESSNHFIRPRFPIHHFQASISVIFVSCTYSWPRPSQSLVVASNLVRQY